MKIRTFLTAALDPRPAGMSFGAAANYVQKAMSCAAGSRL